MELPSLPQSLCTASVLHWPKRRGLCLPCGTFHSNATPKPDCAAWLVLCSLAKYLRSVDSQIRAQAQHQTTVRVEAVGARGPGYSAQPLSGRPPSHKAVHAVYSSQPRYRCCLYSDFHSLNLLLQHRGCAEHPWAHGAVVGVYSQLLPRLAYFGLHCCAAAAIAVPMVSEGGSVPQSVFTSKQQL